MDYLIIFFFLEGTSAQYSEWKIVTAFLYRHDIYDCVRAFVFYISTSCSHNFLRNASRVK